MSLTFPGSNVTDWQHTGVHPRKGVRLESATLATHVYVQPHMIAAAESHARPPQVATPGGEPTPLAPSGQPSPGARNGDPATSHASAAAVTEQARRDIHRQVLTILAEGPASDFDLAARTGRLATSVGCRRKELCRDGLVEQHDRDGVSATGSPCLRWRLTDAGWAAA